MSDIDLSLIKEIAPNTYEIPIGFVPNMKVPGIFYSNKDFLEHLFEEVQDWIKIPGSGLPSLLQIAYVSTLDGISRASYAMPDMHSGYGFPIGGVAAFDLSDEKAIVSPGGVGYDINCGVRLLTTKLTYEEIEPIKEQLVDKLFQTVPTGVGGKRGNFCTKSDIELILKNGAKWAVDRGYGVQADLDNCEEGGCLSNADPSLIGERARARGFSQLGTLGSGNHYVEIQRVDSICDEAAAATMGLFVGQVVVMIHCGSRGLGHQAASDFVERVKNESPLSFDKLPDPQLASAPAACKLGEEYLAAMAAAANYAWANRQLITHFVRRAFSEAFGREIQMDLLYDVAHNIAKRETHGGREFIVHRKGATRAFGPSRAEVPPRYRGTGQPVLIGGSMGTASYVLAGTDESEERSFGSTCHGAGRAMARKRAAKDFEKETVLKQLADKGIIVRAAGEKTVMEEAPDCYKSVESVVDVCQSAGLSRKVARLLPIGVIKG